MRQIIFTLHLFGHEIPLYGYGLMLVAAFFACLNTSRWLARHRGINPEVFANAVLIALVTGLIGARLSHILENLPLFTRSDLTLAQNVGNMLNMREGGLTFYGGFILATPCCILYAWLNRIPILSGMDIVAPVVMIGLGFGRIGCFLNGCCYGAQCDLPWSVQFPYYSNAYIEQYESGLLNPPARLQVATDALDSHLRGGSALVNPNAAWVQTDPELQRLIARERALPVQPAEIYSAITAFLLAALLIAYYTLPHLEGGVFALMLILEGGARYILELLRVEPAIWFPTIAGHTYPFSISMILGLVSVVTGLGMWGLLAALSSPDRISPRGANLPVIASAANPATNGGEIGVP